MFLLKVQKVMDYIIHLYSLEIIGYSGSDWGRNLKYRKNTTRFVFFMGEITFTQTLKKQSIVALFINEA